MRHSLLIGFVLLVGLAAFLLTVPTGCANIIPPSGGPRDSTAPVLLSAMPRDSTLNFRGDRITFTFDEYIDDPQDLQNNLLFTPIFDVNPEIAVRARTVTLRFRDSLKPNTTYTFNFGNAIRDVNESNVLRNFTYILSTGPVLDSLSLSGKVIMAETGKADSTLIVMLHSNLADSAVSRQKPLYVARVDASGAFRFQNLPRGTFAIYALGDAGFLRQYNSPDRQAFAFSDSAVVTGTTNNVSLYAYKIAKPATAASLATAQRGGGGGGGGAQADKRLRFTTIPASGALDIQSEYALNFTTPLRSFDSTKVSLSADTIFSPVRYTVSLDSSRTALRFRSAWREGTPYNLILDKDFADDSAGRKLLKTDTLNFSTKRLSDYARLNIRVRNLDAARNPVLLFLQNDQVVFSTNIKSGTYRATLFNPGEYDLRILYDTNGNGKWDPGSFPATKRQPERAQPISRKINVRAGWDNDFDLSLQ